MNGVEQTWKTGLGLCAIALSLASCNPAHQQSGKAWPGNAGGAAAANPSIYELQFPLTDQNGKTRHLADFQGRPMIASMIYTNCKSVCPRVTADLKGLQRAIGGDARERVRFVLFSLDPQRDDPAALRAYAHKNELDPKRWTLLTTSPEDMRTLAAVLGVRFRPDEGGEIAHTAMIAVVDGKGVIRHQQAGLGNDPTELVAAVRQAR